MSFAPLSAFCDFTQGGKKGLSGKDFVEEGFAAYGAGGLNGYLPEAEFNRDAVVLSAIGARCGKCFLATGSWASLANTQIIFPDPEKADVRFLWYQLNDENRWPRQGLAQPFIRPSDVKSHRVFLPPLPEQRRIATALDRADRLRLKRKQAVALLDRLTRSLFDEMFGDAKTNPFNFPIGRLGEVAEFYAGNSLPEGETFVGQEGGYLLLKVSDMNSVGNEEKIESSSSWRQSPGSKAATCPAGSIVFPKRGGAIGTNKKRLLARPAILDPNVMGVKAGSRWLESDYLFQWFQAFNLSDITSGSSVPQLNKGDLAPLEIVLPPLNAQRAFSQRNRAISKAKSTALRSLAVQGRLFESLRHSAFADKLE